MENFLKRLFLLAATDTERLEALRSSIEELNSAANYEEPIGLARISNDVGMAIAREFTRKLPETCKLTPTLRKSLLATVDQYGDGGTDTRKVKYLLDRAHGERYISLATF